MNSIYSITLYLVKPLLWRNFCEKIVAWAQCGNYGNSLSRIFGKNFVKVTVLLNKLVKSWFDEIFFWWERIFRFSTLWLMLFLTILWQLNGRNIVYNSLSRLHILTISPSLRGHGWGRGSGSTIVGNVVHFCRTCSTVWKLQDFPVIQILREINFLKIWKL